MSIKNRRQIIITTALALVMIPAAIQYTYSAIQNQPEPEKYEAKPDIPLVTTIEAKSGKYSSAVSALGVVQPEDEISLKSQVSGNIVWRNPDFIEGKRIRKGDALIQIDDTDFQAALAAAKQGLAEARLALKQEESHQQQAQREWQRSGIKQKPSSLVLRTPQLNVANAQLQAAKAAVQQAERDLKSTRLTAPFDAVVVARHIGTGSYVERGSDVALLQSSQKAEVHLSLSAHQWSRLDDTPVGSSVNITNRHYPNILWEGQIKSIAQRLDTNTRLRRVIVEIDQPLDQPTPLLFGTFVSVELQGTELNDLFALPSTALTADGYVWYVENDLLERVKRPPVFSSGDTTYIHRGELPHSLNLVTKPLSSYLSGMQVSTTRQTKEKGETE